MSKRRTLSTCSTRRRELSRFALHITHHLGSSWNCFSRKKSCSPALKTKSSPQLTHFRVLSAISTMHPRDVLLDSGDLFVYNALKLHNAGMARIDHWRVMDGYWTQARRIATRRIGAKSFMVSPRCFGCPFFSLAMASASPNDYAASCTACWKNSTVG